MREDSDGKIQVFIIVQLFSALKASEGFNFYLKLESKHNKLKGTVDIKFGQFPILS